LKDETIVFFWSGRVRALPLADARPAPLASTVPPIFSKVSMRPSR